VIDVTFHIALVNALPENMTGGPSGPEFMAGVEFVAQQLDFLGSLGGAQGQRAASGVLPVGCKSGFHFHVSRNLQKSMRFV